MQSPKSQPELTRGCSPTNKGKIRQRVKIERHSKSLKKWSRNVPKWRLKYNLASLGSEARISLLWGLKTGVRNPNYQKIVIFSKVEFGGRKN